MTSQMVGTLDYEHQPDVARWWSLKIAVGAVMMCVAAIGAQFTTRDVAELGPWAMRAVGYGTPASAVVGLVLLTAPPRGRRRSRFAVIVAILAILVLLLLYLSPYLRDSADEVVRVTTLICALLAGVGAYIHLARVLRAAQRPVGAIAFVILALLLTLNATLFAVRYGWQRGVVANGWTYTVPGVGERVTPFAFVQDSLIRPEVEMRRNIEEPLRGAYVLVTVVTPLWCAALMIWLMPPRDRNSRRQSEPPSARPVLPGGSLKTE